MENILNRSEQISEFNLLVSSTYVNLIQLKKEGETKAFNALLLKVLPQVKQYAQHKLNVASKNGKLDKNRFKADDIIDQLFIEVYDHIDAVEAADDFHAWLFKKADELVEDLLVDEEFDTYFFENVDNFSKPEWDEMEEKYSTDGDGDFVMLEEFDNNRYLNNDYLLNAVFVEDKDKEIIANLDKELGAERIKKHADLVLLGLPKTMSSAFELFNTYKFNVHEISKIINTSVSEVEHLLKEAKSKMKSSFLNRYMN
ncbi:sigma-70 family RNA polymerase sigma factor [Cellulophaga sp. E16_2]|uniref:RNA polymerase sigma factor, sigma-70 family n=1 Tax=Cellulophaga algicola (strain DSM 14237 / IC166 / ACAM 630) TaxID=688270 RepID=E6XF76_CELAD|nr:MULTISPECIES: sigma-70 family RNA polymerase sigma factor [Cellulophaga]ADV50312.1 RNA polymerase sigma factor, sigma-70 family [Cellulophaga algicola DSM 14237]MBO0592714.1 sigma-70 family RNA polymerase sigma factor [Cellulophaga sp. E16_2]